MSKSTRETKHTEPRHLLIWRRAGHQLPDLTSPAAPCRLGEGVFTDHTQNPQAQKQQKYEIFDKLLIYNNYFQNALSNGHAGPKMAATSRDSRAIRTRVAR
jgi:hypothetical protein